MNRLARIWLTLSVGLATTLHAQPATDRAADLLDEVKAIVESQSRQIEAMRAELDAASTRPATQPTTPRFDGRSYYVATDGDDNAKGGRADPLRTISHAATRAKPGDQVIIRAGTYRERILLTRGGTVERPIAFLAEKPGSVVIDGTDVLTEWTRHDGAVYSTDWRHDFIISRQADGSPKRFMGLKPPAGCAEQVFFDGALLTQVMNLAELFAGSFFVDWDADRLYVRLPRDVDPSSGIVEASTRDRLFGPKVVAGKAVAAHHVWIDGIIFRRAANFPQRGAVATNDGWRISNCTVERVNALGIGVGGTNVQLINVVAQDNGQTGIGGSVSRNALLFRCTSQRNNYKRFSPTWEAGGGKFSSTDGLTIIQHTARDNAGQGLWIDHKNTNYLIRDSVFTGNFGISAAWQGTGLFLELSEGPGRVEGCYFNGNTGAGVEVAESMGVRIIDSTFSGDHLNMRNMKGRGAYKLFDVKVMGNRFKDAWISIPVTEMEPDGSDARIFADGNTYDVQQGALLMNFAEKKYTTLDQIREILKFEINGRLGEVDAKR